MWHAHMAHSAMYQRDLLAFAGKVGRGARVEAAHSCLPLAPCLCKALPCLQILSHDDSLEGDV